MLKALLKKQFLEISQFLFINRKTGTRRSSLSIMLTTGLICLALLGALLLFGWLALALGQQILPLGIPWFYFLIMGCIAIALGVFGCIISSYNALFHAKDNQLLLTLPIPTRTILLVRLAVAFAMALLHTALVWLPTIGIYCFVSLGEDGSGISAATLAASLLMLPIISLIVLVLSCLIGWITALIALRVKHKSVVSALVTVVFLTLYYVLYTQAISALQDAASWIPGAGISVQSSAWPLYQFGLACTGSALPLVVFALIAFVLMALCWLGMSKSFLRVSSGATSSFSTKKDFAAGAARQTTLKRALFKREVGRLFSSSTYLLNSCLGVLFLILVAGAALLNQSLLDQVISQLNDEGLNVAPLPPIVCVAVICTIAGMDAYATPSVSIEGKSLWIVRSLPVETRHILDAKMQLQMAINGVPALLCVLCLGVALRIDPITMLLMALASGTYVVFSAAIDLVLGLISPNVSWTNEIVPLKQTIWIFLAVMIAMLTGPIMVFLGFVLQPAVGTQLFLIILSIALALGAFAALRWINTEGVRRFEAI